MVIVLRRPYLPLNLLSRAMVASTAQLVLAAFVAKVLLTLVEDEWPDGYFLGVYRLEMAHAKLHDAFARGLRLKPHHAFS